MEPHKLQIFLLLKTIISIFALVYNRTKKCHEVPTGNSDPNLKWEKCTVGLGTMKVSLKFIHWFRRSFGYKVKMNG